MDKRSVEKKLYNLKNVIFCTLTFFLLGTLTELYLINHYTEIFQIIPIVCITFSIFSFVVSYF
jgi:hypothetical protein